MIQNVCYIKSLRWSIPSVIPQQHPCVQSNWPDEEASSHDLICSCLKQRNAIRSAQNYLEWYDWTLETQWRVLPLQLMSILASSFILDIKSLWIPSRFPFLASLRNCSSGSSSSIASPTKQTKKHYKPLIWTSKCEEEQDSQKVIQYSRCCEIFLCANRKLWGWILWNGCHVISLFSLEEKDGKHMTPLQ